MPYKLGERLTKVVYGNGTILREFSVGSRE